MYTYMCIHMYRERDTHVYTHMVTGYIYIYIYIYIYMYIYIYIYIYRYEALGISLAETAPSADLGGSSKRSNENFEDQSGEGFHHTPSPPIKSFPIKSP